MDIEAPLPLQADALLARDNDPGDLARFTPFVSSAAGYGAGQQGVMARVQFQLRF